METTEIPLKQLSEEEHKELVRIAGMRMHELRSALYCSIGGSHGRAGEWTMEAIRTSKLWTRGEMVAHLFDEYLKLKANDA